MLKSLIRNIDALAAGAALLAALAVMIGNVIMRFFFRGPLVWAEDAAFALVFWAIFLGGAYVYRKGANLNSNMIVNRFSPNSRYLIKLFVDFLALLTLAVFTHLGALYVQYTAEQISAVSGFPLWIRSSAIPVGFGLSFLYAVYYFIRDLLTAELRKGEEI